MKKYTDEELSRILGEHACGYLVVEGANHFREEYYLFPFPEERLICNYPRGCINQVAYNEAYSSLAVEKK